MGWMDAQAPNRPPRNQHSPPFSAATPLGPSQQDTGRRGKPLDERGEGVAETAPRYRQIWGVQVCPASTSSNIQGRQSIQPFPGGCSSSEPGTLSSFWESARVLYVCPPAWCTISPCTARATGALRLLPGRDQGQPPAPRQERSHSHTSHALLCASWTKVVSTGSRRMCLACPPPGPGSSQTID